MLTDAVPCVAQSSYRQALSRLSETETLKEKLPRASGVLHSGVVNVRERHGGVERGRGKPHEGHPFKKSEGLNGVLDPWGFRSANWGHPIFDSIFPQTPLKLTFPLELRKKGCPKSADPAPHGSNPSPNIMGPKTVLNWLGRISKVLTRTCLAHASERSRHG